VCIFLLTSSAVNQVRAQDDLVEDEVDESSEAEAEDIDSKVESEPDATEPEETATTGKDAPEDEEETSSLKSSPSAVTTVLFPDYPDKSLPAGKVIYVVVGLHNKGDDDFVVETIDASFRYPQDYSYFIQNFTGNQYNRIVQPGSEASFLYAFHPHESYGGRPFGLTVMMLYKDSDGNQFGNGVFNETITFKELEETFDGETFFLYVLLAAIGLLVIFGCNYALSHSKLKKIVPKSVPEVGTQNARNNVDYDWLPKETTTEFKASPRQSPRQRKVKRNAGSAEE
jgi:translocon-associated protein subunit alpha